MKKQIKIDKIKLKIGDAELELTVEELKELRYVIDNLIGKDKDKEYITIPQMPVEPYNPSYPTNHWTVPYCGDDPFANQILCGDGGFSSQNTELYSSQNMKVEF